MITLKHVLAATDFTEYGSLAVRYACELASAFHADLHLIHVLQPDLASFSEIGLAYPEIQEVQEKLRNEAMTQLHALPGDGIDKQLMVVREVMTGPPFTEIVRYAKNNPIDLIVVGTHGRGAIAHMLMGSTAEKVVRTAPCPVLTVRHGQHDFIMP